jgi:hypothetical protein
MTTQARQETRTSLLTKVLRADGAFAVLSGTGSILGANLIASLLDIRTPIFLVVLGIVLLAYGGMLLYFAGREMENRQIARAAIALNVLWVIGSYAGLLLGFFSVNATGKWAIALVAEVVALFALLEIYALWRLNRT